MLGSVLDESLEISGFVFGWSLKILGINLHLRFSNVLSFGLYSNIVSLFRTRILLITFASLDGSSDGLFDSPATLEYCLSTIQLLSCYQSFWLSFISRAQALFWDQILKKYITSSCWISKPILRINFKAPQRSTYYYKVLPIKWVIARKTFDISYQCEPHLSFLNVFLFML